MRELLFKNMTSWEHNKRDIYVHETVKKNGILAESTRRCLYFIKDRTHIDNPMDLKRIQETRVNEKGARHFFILKERDSNLGVDKLMCKAAGTFYAMVNQYLYCIIFIHTFKISFSTLKED